MVASKSVQRRIAIQREGEKMGKRLTAEELARLCAKVRGIANHILAIEAELAEARAEHPSYLDIKEQAGALAAKVARYEECLKWYADGRHIYLHEQSRKMADQLLTHEFVSSMLCTEAETGAKARAALAEEGEG